MPRGKTRVIQQTESRETRYRVGHLACSINPFHLATIREPTSDITVINRTWQKSLNYPRIDIRSPRKIQKNQRNPRLKMEEYDPKTDLILLNYETTIDWSNVYTFLVDEERDRVWGKLWARERGAGRRDETETGSSWRGFSRGCQKARINRPGWQKQVAASCCADIKVFNRPSFTTFLDVRLPPAANFPSTSRISTNYGISNPFNRGSDWIFVSCSTIMRIWLTRN